jgi:hypothetical protein
LIYPYHFNHIFEKPISEALLLEDQQDESILLFSKESLVLYQLKWMGEAVSGPGLMSVCMRKAWG